MSAAACFLILSLVSFADAIDVVDLEGFPAEDPFSLWFLSSFTCVRNESIGYVFNVPPNGKVGLEMGYEIVGDPDRGCDGGDSARFTVADEGGKVVFDFAICGYGSYESYLDQLPFPTTLTVLYRSAYCYEDTGFWGTVHLAEPDAPPLQPYFDCGIRASSRTGRVVGGEDAEPRSIPWQVGLVADVGDVFCGGSLVSPHHVLTAAHCMQGLVPSGFVVWVGGHNVTRMGEEEGSFFRNVSCISLHPDYDWGSGWDFAVLTLDEPVPIEGDSPTRAVCLPRDDDDSHEEEGAELTTSGWGDLEYLGDGPEVLQRLLVTVGKCEEPAEHRICASAGVIGNGSKQVAESCDGDSGGPLTYTSGGKTTVVGVDSTTDQCGKERPSAGYAKVSAAVDWILHQRIFDPQRPNRCRRPSQ